VDVLPRPDPSASPLAFFGYELRRIREEAGLTQEQLGELINYSGAQVSAVENAKRNPKKDFADRCDEALNTGGHLASTWVMVRRGVYHPPVRSYFELEREATCLRVFQPIVVPGLLQTEAYALAITRGGRPRDGEERIQARGAERMERQAILREEDPPALFAIMDEAVLRRPVGGPAVMRDQLEHLLNLALVPGITIQVVPSTVGAYPGLDGPIVLLSFQGASDVVYFDHAGGGQVVDQPDEVAEAAYLFDALRAEALPQGASSELIREAMRQWTEAITVGGSPATAAASMNALK
jgi:transcriptional regulator with XRE-family HTH domain